MSTSALYRATESVTEDELRWMAFAHYELPNQFAEFRPLREGLLDNASMAEQGFGERTAEDLRALGRITGYICEFASTIHAEWVAPRTHLAIATVVHLFDHGQAVSRWMTEVFLREFEEAEGRAAAPGYRILSAERFSPEGLSDESVGINVLHSGPAETACSTVIDFRLGRLLGVAYLITVGDVPDRSLVEGLAKDLEKKMVRVVLNAA